MAELVNRVKNSKLLTLDLEKWVDPEDFVELDLADWLHMGLVVRESDFRQAVASMDSEPFRGRVAWIRCSTQAILPKWAWILPTLRLQDIARAVHVAPNRGEAMRRELLRMVREHDWSAYQGRFVILKGCSRFDIHESVYTEAAAALSRHAAKILYGEACSNVPLFRAPGKAAEPESHSE